MSNSIRYSGSNSEIDNQEEEKEPLRFDTIESIKNRNESIFVPEYNIKNDRLESINISLFEKNSNNKIEKTDSNVDKQINVNNNFNNNSHQLDESINQSVMSFQDLPLNNNSNLNLNNNLNNNKNNANNQGQINSNFNNNDFRKNIEPYLEVEDAGEKKDMYFNFNFNNFLTLSNELSFISYKFCQKILYFLPVKEN